MTTKINSLELDDMISLDWGNLRDPLNVNGLFIV